MAQLITFGNTPHRPETGPGNLEFACETDGTAPVVLTRFVEKPYFEHAAKTLAASNYIWKAHIFVSFANEMIAAFKVQRLEMLVVVYQSYQKAETDVDFLLFVSKILGPGGRYLER